MAEVINSEGSVSESAIREPALDEKAAGKIESAVEHALVPGPLVPAKESKWYLWRSNGTALIRYLLDSEVHTFAFSVAANAILSFIPFVMLMYKLAYAVFSSAAMRKTIDDVMLEMVRYFFPSNQFFVAQSLKSIASQHSVTLLSVFMIMVACTGIFLPLEVALNQAWGVSKSRNYLMNQTVAFGLAFLMAILGMVCVLINAGVHNSLAFVFFQHTENFVFRSITFLVMAATTGVASILFFFSIYWLLPNRKVPWRPVLRTSIITGVIWLVSKYAFVAFLPHLDLQALYGPFYVSVGLLFWAYTSGLIMFAGAQFSVTHLKDIETGNASTDT